ncbi:LysR family transcriptional regulator [Colwellia psychrerythraea]|uniref:Transcriptional regulator, LysR family n=1 Tax=Colwellia psychrerythraea TaxID=28229 RepID=A0A099KCR4_COLPS|nr:LysR family transcriptional regulator [Colwellia psychrerythraea]KGJ88529.1 transcriptional regulator, LysR family [Colwellia psychrerythraea]
MVLLEQKLARMDLNLLVSLSVLLKEKNVTRAAERLFLSQSAMSRTLQRLRDLFDDPLFYRTASGIVPTEKAQRIEALLPDILQKLESILHDDDFSPVTCDKHFSISLPSLTSLAIFLPLVQAVNIEAPAVKLSEYSAKMSSKKSLESGFLDFAIHVEKPTDNAFIATSLGKLSLSIFARKTHPLTAQNEVELADCLSYRFIELNVNEDTGAIFTNPIDSILLKQGFKRDIQLKTSQLSILIELLNSSDTLLIAPSFFIPPTTHKEKLVSIYQFEQTESNMVELFLLQHQRTVNSAAHQWLRDKVLQQTLQFITC